MARKKLFEGGGETTYWHAVQIRYFPFFPLNTLSARCFFPPPLCGSYGNLFGRVTGTELTGCLAAAAAAAAAAFIPAVGYILCQQRILLLPAPTVAAPRPPPAADAGVLLRLL